VEAATARAVAPAAPAGSRGAQPGESAGPTPVREGEASQPEGPARPARAAGPRRAASGRVLVLNASYEPLNVCTVRRAVVLVLKEKAELVEQATRTVRSESVTLPHPVVIRLVTYVSLPRDKRRRRITRRAVFARDSWTCQYCGTGTHLTVDHVVPRSRGGKTNWENIVTSCAPCNRRKGNRMPVETGMRPRKAPRAPGPTVFIRVAAPVIPATWQQYLL
jgi:5-methylcytosine-specific restriction endonuclease McrA